MKKQASKVISATKKGKKLKDLNSLINSDKKKFMDAAKTYYEKTLSIAGESAMEELLERVKARLK